MPHELFVVVVLGFALLLAPLLARWLDGVPARRSSSRVRAPRHRQALRTDRIRFRLREAGGGASVGESSARGD